MSKIKKALPKVQKRMKKLLTDRSKAVALGVIMGVSVSQVDAATTTTTSSPNLPYPPVSDCGTNCDTGWVGPTNMTRVTSTTCNHASGIVNGHYSATPSVRSSNTIYRLYSRSSHSSSGSGGGGGWC